MLVVKTAECPQVADGRARHVYTKVDDEFVCANCGKVSDPRARWS